MKRQKRQPGRIDAIRGEAGTIVVEAALVLPLFLFVLLFLILMVRISMVQMALQDAADQTVRQAAAHMYPAALAARAAERSAAVSAAPSLPADAPQAWQLPEELLNRLPSPAGPVLEGALRGDWQPAVDAAASAFGGGVVEPLVRELAGDSVLNPDRIKLSRLNLPDLRNGDSAMLGLELRYAFPLRLPFTREALTVRAAARERVWIPDALPAARTAEGEEGSGRQIVIVGLEPTPVRPGRKARLIVRTDPGSRVSLTVQYKSGTSRAKHLGEAVADADGIVAWEWLVSGNTTPGTWELFVTGDEGARAGTHFDVEKRT